MLKNRVLSFIEVHRKSSVYGLYNSFPDSTPAEIDNIINELQSEGWLRRNETQVIDGDKCNFPCVIRSNKSLYEQKELLGSTNGSLF